MQQRYIEGRLREVCAACNFILYRNPIPAVGVVVELDGGIVLVKRKFEPRANHWGLPAGYLELSESTEDAAIRECREETSLEIQIDTLLGVYSFGTGVYSGLIIIYAAHPVGGTLQAADDAADAQVFDPACLPSPLAFSTHVQAIEDWQRWNRDEALPVVTTPLHTEEGVIIRQASLQDAVHVLALLPLLTHGLLDEQDQMVMTTALFRRRVCDPDSPILVAEIDGTVVGFATVTIRRSLTGWRAVVDDLVVDPAYRRRHVGQTLVQSAVQLAQSRNCEILHLDASYVQQEERDAFYQACGFAAGNVASLMIG